MRKTMISMLAMLPFLVAAASAQGPNTATTMYCQTSDGEVIISETAITVADYELRFDTVVRDGVVKYTDANSGAVATLDSRDDQGLYLEITERGERMQLVAARDQVRYQINKGTEPAAPAWSSIVPHDNTRSTPAVNDK